MEIHSVRIAEHGPVQTPTMSYSQRQPQNHRPNHSQATSDIYKPSRSPLPNPARYPYPASPAQLPPQAQATINQVQVSAQRYGQVAPPPQQQQPQAQHQPPPPAAVFQNAGYRDYRSQRISLLHPEYASGRAREAQLQGVVHLDGQAGQQPIKKIRLQDHKDVIQPLRIDTREQPGTYNPQVEAISPTLPDHLQQEEQTFRTTKDELIQQIGKVDREIAKAESQITILKKKEKELDEIANNKPSVKSEVEEDAQPKHQSLPQKIYAENRRKAQSAHAKLDALGAKVEWPLYNQPSDTAVYHDNKRKHMAFKKRLLDYFKKRHVDKDGRNGYLTETYSKLMQEWVRKVEKIENTTKRKAKEAKNREFFEKVFPELRKQREDKERFNRVGARVKSEADMEEIMDNLQEQAMEDKKMRSYAVIPPILLDSKERKLTYQDNNGFIEDMEMVYKSRQFLNIWTPSEKEIFKEKYLQHPKNFGVIASFIERKTVSDCVQYYYLSKKTENYKQLLRKSRQRTRSSRNNSQKVTSANTSVVDILTTGVTTRLQREQQQQRTVVQQSRAEAATTSSDTPPTHSTAASNSISTPSIATALTTSSSSTAVTSLSSTTTSSSSLSTCSTTPPATTPTVISTNTSSNNTSQLTTATTTIVTSIIATNSSTTTPSTNNSSSIISTNSVPVMSTTTIVVTSNSSGCNINNNNNNNNNSAGGGGGGNSPKLLNDNNSIIIEHSTTTVNNSISKCDFNNVVTTATTTTTSTSGSGGGEESYHRSSGGSSNQAKFFGDDAKVDGNNGLATAGDAVHDGVVVTIKKEVEPSQDIASDQTASSASTTIAENKKKKERRKDKENANVETSDDDDDDNNAEIPDKSIQGSCIVCTAQLGPHLQSRPLVPSHATQYGLHEDQIPPNGRVCNTCRCKCVRSRYTHCPLPACPNSRGRVKRLRSFPQRLQDLPSDVRDPLLAEFHVPSGVTKCCSACFNRIQRRLGPAEEWADDEIQQLKHALTELGASWQTIADRLNKSPQQVRSFYAANRKRLALEACLGDRKPALTDEEESGSSTSSCEEPLLRERHSSDTASAAESPPSIPANPSQPIKKEDYDSSATETADEAQTPDHYQGSATITPVTNDGQPKQNASPLSVRELVLNVIEFQLMKNPGGVGQIPSQNPPTSGMAPTISSILSSNDSNDVTIVNEYNLNQVQQTRPRNDLSLAKLVTPLIGATITPVPASHQQQQQQQAEQMRDDLVVVQVQDGGREPETLDLSLKKPRELPPPPHKLQQQQQQQHHREYIYHERKSQAFGVRQPQPKLPSPKPANPKSGSITLGTPIINQPRYEGLLRQLPPEAKMGSITQGTPIHLPQHMQQQQQQEKRVYDFFKQQQQQQQQQRGNQVQVQPQPPPPPPSSGYQYRQPAYTVEQQLTSRQIIMNDYITSQQMYRRNEKQYYQQQQQQQPQQANSPVLHRTPPPPLPSQNQANQQRQGVIQRHTRPQYLPPGHEALSSLVDVAVQQPSLPVPSAPHEGLGKTMADNIMEQPHRFQVLQQQHLRQQQQRMMEEQQRRIVYQNQNPRQQQQQVRNQSGGDSSTSLTAASLIDAIITHQINQTSEGGREIMTNQREPRAGDLLFQGFHPPQQQQQQQQQTSREENNVDRPSSVISIDLEAVPEPLNKNLTVKELTDSVISHDFSARPQQQQQAPPPSSYYMQQQQEEQWKRRLKEEKRSGTPQQQQDERQIIRIAQSQQQQQQQQKFHVEPVSPPDNHWSNEQSFRRYPQQVVQQQQQQQQQSGQQQQHMSPLDYVKNRIVEVMRTEDDKKDDESKERSESPGDMVIDEEKHEEFSQNSQQQQQQQSGFGYSFIHKENTANDTRNNEPKPLLSAQYEPLSDED